MVSGIVGVIFPVPTQFIDRFFKNNKNVFVKCVRGEYARLKESDKFIFYESYGKKKLVGEGIINKIEYLTAKEILDKYKDNLFLDTYELYNYVGDRQHKKLLTIVIVNMKKYVKTIQFSKRITMGGQYITKKEYQNILDNIIRDNIE